MHQRFCILACIEEIAIVRIESHREQVWLDSLSVYVDSLNDKCQGGIGQAHIICKDIDSFIANCDYFWQFTSCT